MPVVKSPISFKTYMQRLVSCSEAFKCVCVCARFILAVVQLGLCLDLVRLIILKMVLVLVPFLLLYELRPTSTISLAGFACKFTLHPCILPVLSSDRWLLDHGSQGRAVVTCSR